MPMAIANDHSYGYVCKLLAQEGATWLDKAAASLCWTTMLVYYLETPWGHLMTESVQGAQARTAARGNLFSFSTPWEDIEERCGEVVAASTMIARGGREPSGQHVRLPHGEGVLATLVHVHIIGGSKDLAQHLAGVKIRPAVVRHLIAELRRSGHAGYDEQSAADVARRIRALYGDDSTPACVASEDQAGD